MIFRYWSFAIPKTAVIEPKKVFSSPEKCLYTFFREVLDKYVEDTDAVLLGNYESEMGLFPVYSAQIDGEDIALTLATVGGASTAIQADFLFGLGVRTLFCTEAAACLTTFPGVM